MNIPRGCMLGVVALLIAGCRPAVHAPPGTVGYPGAVVVTREPEVSPYRGVWSIDGRPFVGQVSVLSGTHEVEYELETQDGELAAPGHTRTIVVAPGQTTFVTAPRVSVKRDGMMVGGSVLVVLGVIGQIVGAVALAERWGSGPDFFNPAGAYGIVLGAGGMAGGIPIIVLGSKPKVHGAPRPE